MTKPKMFSFEQEDILHLVMSEEEEASSVELSPNITAELNAQGELIGLEILQASTYVRDSILEAVQAKLLNLASPSCLSADNSRVSQEITKGQAYVVFVRRGFWRGRERLPTSSNAEVTQRKNLKTIAKPGRSSSPEFRGPPKRRR